MFYIQKLHNIEGNVTRCYEGYSVTRDTTGQGVVPHEKISRKK